MFSYGSSKLEVARCVVQVTLSVWWWLMCHFQKTQKKNNQKWWEMAALWSRNRNVPRVYSVATLWAKMAGWLEMMGGKSKTSGWSHKHTCTHKHTRTHKHRGDQVCKYQLLYNNGVQRSISKQTTLPGSDWLGRQQEINAGFQHGIWRGYISHTSINTFKVMSRKTPPGTITTVNIANADSRVSM